MVRFLTLTVIFSRVIDLIKVDLQMKLCLYLDPYVCKSEALKKLDDG